MAYDKNSISVILPTFNEQENIQEMIRQLNLYVKPNEIIVIDDNSKDKTRDLAKSSSKNVIVINRVNKRGVASAIYDGIKRSNGKIVVWLDADLSMPPIIIPKMIGEIINNGYAITVGSRYVKGGSDKRPFLRVLTSKALNLFALLLLGYGIRDYDSGFVVSRRNVFEQVTFNVGGHGEYCIEFLYNAAKKGYKIKEVPYIFTDRKAGKSKTVSNILSLPVHGLNYGFRILKLKFFN